MPFKSEKQRKWMHANEPEMAKKWEKEESMNKLKEMVREELKSVNEGFDKYHLGGLLDSKLKKRLERTIRIIGGIVDAVGDDYIKFRIGSMDLARLPGVIKKLDRNKNVWIGDKRKKNIWDRRRNIDKLHGEAVMGSSSIPVYKTPKAYSKSTQIAIDIDKEDDDVEESLKAPFRRRKYRGLGRPITVGLNESDLGLTYKKGKTIKVTHKKSGKELVIIDKPNVRKEYEKIGFFAEGQVNEGTPNTSIQWSNPEARIQVATDIGKMSKHLGKASQQAIKIMMQGVKSGRYDALDLSRGIEYGNVRDTHTGERDFIRVLWSKIRNGLRRYNKRGKLRNY
ncbi:hypothetical protein H8D04_00535 [bacterium]|nr:hypothetical protein [bacterium]